MTIPKSRSHGRIGEAAALAKCWMHGIPAHSTGGLRSNFAGADLLIDTEDPGRKLLVEVKTGYDVAGDWVYLTQNSDTRGLTHDKFSANFVVLVNLDRRIAKHQHNGELDFEHLAFFVLPRDVVNRLYREAVQREIDRPKKDGGQRSLANLLVKAPAAEVVAFRNAWHLIREAAKHTA